MGYGKKSKIAEKVFLLPLSFLVFNFISLFFMPAAASVSSDVSNEKSEERMRRDAGDFSAEEVQKYKSEIRVINRKEEADKLLVEGSQKYKIESFEAALQDWTRALRLYRELNDHKGEAEATKSIESLIAPLKQNLDLYRKESNLEKEVKVIRNIVDIYFELRRFTGAEKFIQLSIAEFTKSQRESKSKPLVKALHDYANRFEAQGWNFLHRQDWSNALEAFQPAMTIYRQAGNPYGESSALTGITIVYDILGQHEKALEHSKTGINLAQKSGNRFAEGRLLLNLGEIHYFHLKRPEEALIYFQQALPLLQSTMNQPLESYALSLIGLSLADVGDFEKALKSSNQALQLVRKAGNKFFESFTLSALGKIHLDRKDFGNALDVFQQALSLSQKTKNRWVERETLSMIGDTLNQQNQPELAIIFYKQSVNVTEMIREQMRSLPRESQESYTQTVSGTYRALADLLIQQGRLSEAQAVLELLKLRELREFTRDAGIDSPGISLAKVEEAALKQILEQFTTIGNFTQKLAQCQQTNCPNLRQLQQQRDVLNATVRQELDQQRAILAKHFSTEASTLTPEKLNAEARRIVNAQPGTVLIYPLVLKDKIQFLMALQAGNGAVTFRPFETQVSAEQLFKTIQTFRQQLGETTPAGRPVTDLKTVQATSQQLYTWLIKPLEAELNDPVIKHLVFVPDSTTRYIPLAALYDGQQYLIQRFTVSTITAASQTDTTTRTPQLTGQEPMLLAMGASQFPNLNPLHYVPAELAAITRTKTSGDRQGIYPGSKYLNLTFDYEALQTSLQKGTYRILHLATHGAFKPGRVEESYLVPGRGQNLTTELIDQLGNYGLGNIHLVVLSACETAVGDRASDGIEIPGISYFFLKNDVKSVIASLWNVNDASTALLMERFYQNLATGTMTKAAALQTVQQDFIQGKLTAKDAPVRSDIAVTVDPGVRPFQNKPDNFSHPYYWAPFILIGNSL